MKKLFRFFVATVVCLNLVSCEKDGEPASSQIVGTWVQTSVYDSDTDEWTVLDIGEDGEDLANMVWTTFEEDGNVKTYGNSDVTEDEYAYFENGKIYLEGGSKNLKKYKSILNGTYALEGNQLNYKFVGILTISSTVVFKNDKMTMTTFKGTTLESKVVYTKIKGYKSL